MYIIVHAMVGVIVESDLYQKTLVKTLFYKNSSQWHPLWDTDKYLFNTYAVHIDCYLLELMLYYFFVLYFIYLEKVLVYSVSFFFNYS